MELTLRNGLPTKKSLEQMIEGYDRKFRLRPSQLYAKGNPCLVWQDKYTQERMDDFIQYAVERGVNFGKYSPYDSPSVGHLYIKPSVKVVAESKPVIREFKGLLEACAFCGENTRFWYKPTNTPCCELCAKEHGPDDFKKLSIKEEQNG
ncbi:hypothetical protein UFOVP1492_5 [uncultured Caudovirales phage]|uniref:Uncharacterized protein n=1 Tax=uncultured Caudovirales phage TaxID=2100421 RepID=A0A6J5RG63_9CAUD|nr:hypothetical protein UFOVP1127_129 [uncultured Caudovirales phage]CAB4193446.1 hypothetical protein UFOVP1242_81 [uncultured Caudovirales phage]CAB4217011.1 hypothetical protein UFOVP1492_5 [uncultured Caudovirales phage]CAB5231203.1 hypothetical protein UFOVP1580_34 [uncultured Caudovirales phage]